MAKTVSDLSDLPLTQETPSMQTIDMFNSYVNAPVVKKLDADEYMANDLDGVTEGLLGSGNLNFLMMQAGQTDQAMSNSNADDITTNGDQFLASPLTGSSQIPVSADGNAGSDTSMDRGFDMPIIPGDGTNGTGNATASNATSLGASSLVSNSQSATPFSDTSSFSSTQSATNGSNGNNGTNGTNGEGGGNNTVINNTTSNTINIDNSVGDTTIDIIDDNLYTTINNITNNTTDFLTEVVNNFTDIVNNIFDGNGLGPVGLSLDATLDNLTNLNLDIISGENIVNVLDETLNLSPVLDPVSGLVGDILANISLDVILNPFQYDTSPNDFDLHVGTDVALLGLTLPDLGLDIPLDPVEALLGDIDVSLDIGEILAGLPLLGGGADNGDTNIQLAGITDIPALTPVISIVDGLFNPVEDLAGDIDILGDLHVGLLGIGQDGTGPDTDITLPLDLDLAGGNLLNDALSISLDPLENIIGDVDLDLSVAGNILGDVADGLVDNIAGGTGTDNILSDVGNVTSDLVSDLLPFNNNAGGDTDLSLNTGIDVLDTGLVSDGLDVALNPVESLIGDLDITASPDLDLFNIGDSQSASDTDLHLQIDLVDTALPPIDLPVNLDLVESIVGDIDLPVDVSTELLSPDLLGNVMETVDNILDTAINLLDTIPTHTGGLDLGALLPGDAGGGDILSPVTSWTETLIPDAGSLLGDGLLSGVNDLIPDPVSIIPALTLPTVPVVPVVPVIPSGGSHHGGLFGGGGLFG